jgi:hypothetical protein
MNGAAAAMVASSGMTDERSPSASLSQLSRSTREGMSKPWRPGSVAFGLAPRRAVSYCLAPAPRWCGLGFRPPVASRGGSAGRRLCRTPCSSHFNWYTVIEIGIAAVVVVLMVLVSATRLIGAQKRERPASRASLCVAQRG